MNHKSKALGLVLQHFEISGGKCSEIEVTFKGTKTWKEAIRHSLCTVDEILLLGKKLPLEVLEYYVEVKKEINKL